MAKIAHLVVDSAPIINGSFNKDIAENLFSVPEVLAEIVDKRSRDFLDLLHKDIKVINPTAENVREIVSFSKQTGDFPSLSITDIKVMALTLELEKKYNPGHTLRSLPEQIQSIVPSLSKTEPKKDLEVPSNLDEMSLKDVEELEHSLESENSEDDEDSWITPQNISSLNQEKPVSLLPTEQVKVACASNDFAMQNCMKHIGLNVIGEAGCIIKELKNFVLRCHVCYKITKDMNKEFCPSCGHNTLLRTTYAIDENGNMKIFLKKDFQYNNRGTKVILVLFLFL